MTARKATIPHAGTPAALLAPFALALWALAAPPGAAQVQDQDPTPRPALSGYSYMSPSTQSLQDDDFVNPGYFAVTAGERLWATNTGPEGRSCASCHGPDSSMAGVATRYPRINPATGTLENLEMRVNRCVSENQQAPAYDEGSDPLLALVTMISNRSRGMAMAVAVDGPAAPYFDRGREIYMQRRGQLDLACTHCHDDRAGERLRGDVISQGHINGFPIFRLKWGDMGSRHRMFAWCNTSLRAEPSDLGSDAYLALELYVAWRGNGLPIETPAVRR
jgi:sulfur-oxidizing protein SoxA